jgi:hypothetical protein
MCVRKAWKTSFLSFGVETLLKYLSHFFYFPVFWDRNSYAETLGSWLGEGGGDRQAAQKDRLFFALYVILSLMRGSEGGMLI